MDEKIDELLNVFENQCSLWGSEDEIKLLKNRINISFSEFSIIYKTVEDQYNRCLTYVNFDIENKLDKILYENMMEFVKTNKLNEKYKIMQVTDNIIMCNIICNEENKDIILNSI